MMLKGCADSPFGKIYFLGLSDGNIEKLKNKEPILFAGEQIGIKGLVLICYGETEDDIERELREVWDK